MVKLPKKKYQWISISMVEAGGSGNDRDSRIDWNQNCAAPSPSNEDESFRVVYFRVLLCGGLLYSSLDFLGRFAESEDSAKNNVQPEVFTFSFVIGPRCCSRQFDGGNSDTCFSFTNTKFFCCG